MAKKIYGSVGGLSDNVAKIYGSVSGLSKNVVKGYCSVGGLSQLFFGSSPVPPTPIPTYNIVPEYSYVARNSYQVHNLLTPQVALDALYQYFNKIYSSSLSSITYLKAHWTEIRSDILSYISSFNTVYLSFNIYKNQNQIYISANVGQNDFPKSTVIESQSSPRYGDLWRIYNNSSENIQTTNLYSLTVTENSYTVNTPAQSTSVMNEIGLYGAVYDNVKVTDSITISNYGMKEADDWNPKIWNGYTDIDGDNVWTDGTNIYYSMGSAQYVLNKSTSTWTAKTWNITLAGSQIWSDGDNIYHSSPLGQYVLNKSTGSWNTKTWNGYTPTSGGYVWTDGNNFYYGGSNSNQQYILDKSTDTWSKITWNGLPSFGIYTGNYVWSDGSNIYYSFPYGDTDYQYVFSDKSTNTWTAKTWNISGIDGRAVWTDGTDYYTNTPTGQYVLDKSTGLWNNKTWKGATPAGGYIWNDGTDIYFSNGSSTQFVLNKPT